MKAGRSDHEISKQPLVGDKTQGLMTQREQIKLKLDGQETKSIKTNSPRGSTLKPRKVTRIVIPLKRESKQSLSQDDSKKKKVG